MPTIVKPTVGRKVWCFGSVAHYQAYQRGEHEAQPYDGTVIFVHDDRCINVQTISHTGVQESILGIQLWQEGDPEPNGTHARWMPYQTKQQAKADDALGPKVQQAQSVGTTGETQAASASTETDALPVSLTGDPEPTQEPSTETGQQTQVSDPSVNPGGDLGSPL